MQTGVVVPVVQGAVADELESVCGKLEVIFSRVREAWKDAAGLLARLSGPQLDQVKRRFRGIVSSDHLDRLAMLGRGEIAPHLALPERAIPASALRRFNDTTLAALNDADREVEVWRADGKVFVKRTRDLGPMELAQIVGEDGRIRSADQQRRAVLALAKTPVEKPTADGLLFDGLVLGKDGESVILYGRFSSDDPGAKRYAMKIPVRTLRDAVR